MNNETKNNQTPVENSDPVAPETDKKRRGSGKNKNQAKGGIPNESGSLAPANVAGSSASESFDEAVALTSLPPRGDTSVRLDQGQLNHYVLKPTVSVDDLNPVEGSFKIDRLKTALDFPKKVKAIAGKTLDLTYGYGNEDLVSQAKNRVDYSDFETAKNTRKRTPLANVANFDVELNIAGYLPNEKFRFISKIAANNDGIPTITYTDRRDTKLRTWQLDVKSEEFNQDSYQSATYSATENFSLTSKEDIQYNKSNLGNSFNADINSNNYFSSVRKIRENIKDWVEKDPDKRPKSILTDIYYLYDVISNASQFATFLYILIDSVKGNFDNIPLIAKKLGIFDSTIKRYVTMSNTHKSEFVADLQKFKKVFEKLPVNKEVIAAWNNYKKASKLKDADIDDEENLLFIPFFNVHFDECKTYVSKINLKANAATSSLSVPYGSMLTTLVYYVNKAGTSANNVGGNAYAFALGDIRASSSNKSDASPSSIIYKGRKDIKASNVQVEGSAWSADQLRSCFKVSHVRMTTEVQNVLTVLLCDPNVSYNLGTYIDDCSTFWDIIGQSGILDGTVFAYMTPEFPGFKMLDGTSEVMSYKVHAPLLANLTSYYDDIDGNDQRYCTLPLHSVNESSNENVQADGIEHTVIYSELDESALIQKRIKAICTTSAVASSDLSSIDTGVINGSFSCVVLPSCIILPFSNYSSAVFSMNVTTYAGSGKLVFNKGRNDYLYYNHVLFEFTTWMSSHREDVNSSRNMVHVSNSHFKDLVACTDGSAPCEGAHPYYFTADKYVAFSNAQQFAWNVAFARKYGFLSLIPNFWPFSTTIDNAMNLGSEHALLLVQIAHYMAIWTVAPFSTKDLSMYVYDSFEMLSTADLKISKSDKA